MKSPLVLSATIREIRGKPSALLLLALPQSFAARIQFLEKLVNKPGQSFGIAFGCNQLAEPSPFLIIPLCFPLVIHGVNKARRLPNCAPYAVTVANSQRIYLKGLSAAP
jgi:hypothetical protein